MTKEQFEHYLKGGVFTAIYAPKSLDIDQASKHFIGHPILVHQNMINNPLQSPEIYKGQHAFNSNVIGGWFPEEDILGLEIVNDFIDQVAPLPVYMYRLIYEERNQIMENFGKIIADLPFIVTREYGSDMDSYVKKLSNPQATLIEKCIWRGEYNEKLNWSVIYGQTYIPS